MEERIEKFKKEIERKVDELNEDADRRWDDERKIGIKFWSQKETKFRVEKLKKWDYDIDPITDYQEDMMIIGIESGAERIRYSEILIYAKEFEGWNYAFSVDSHPNKVILDFAEYVLKPLLDKEVL